MIGSHMDLFNKNKQQNYQGTIRWVIVRKNLITESTYEIREN